MRTFLLFVCLVLAHHSSAAKIRYLVLNWTSKAKLAIESTANEQDAKLIAQNMDIWSRGQYHATWWPNEHAVRILNRQRVKTEREEIAVLMEMVHMVFDHTHQSCPPGIEGPPVMLEDT